jgi:hypothetical protein
MKSPSSRGIARMLCASWVMVSACAHSESSTQPSEPRHGVQVQASPAAHPDVELRYDWPDVLIARVRVESEESSPEGKQRMVTTHRLRAEKVRGGGLKVSEDDWSMLESDGSDEVAQRLAAALGKQVISFRVDPAGRFEGVINAEQVAGRVVANLSKGASKEVRSQFEQVVTADFLNELADSDWAALVGDWRGYESLPMHREVRGEGTESTPFTAAPQRMFTAVRASERAPCSPDDSERQCIVLQSTMTLASGADPVLLAAVAEGLGVAPDRVDPNSLSFEKRLRLVTRPATMVPSSVEVATSTRVAFRDDDGHLVPFNHEEREVTSFAYESP